MKRRSLNPSLINSAIFAPFLSKRAFVATVVPIRIHDINDPSISPSIFLPVSCKFLTLHQRSNQDYRDKYKYLLENPANTFARGIVVVGRIHGEQFHHSNFPAWTPSVHVGKRAAAIYGELEFITTHFYLRFTRFTASTNTRGSNLLDSGRESSWIEKGIRDLCAIILDKIWQDFNYVYITM